jgi:hypothetical protein
MKCRPFIQASLIGVVFCLILLFAGCTPDPRLVTHTSLGGLEPGISPEQARVLTGATPQPIFEFSQDDHNWIAEFYLHHSGNAASQYLTLYDETGLRFWGFLHEFERQGNAEITNAARKAKQEYLQWWNARSSPKSGTPD